MEDNKLYLKHYKIREHNIPPLMKIQNYKITKNEISLLTSTQMIINMAI